MKIILLFLVVSFSIISSAQDSTEQRGFKKEKLFTGGSLSLSFGNSFLIGVNPVLGYSLTNWADVGIAVNYNYTSYRDVSVFDDKLRQSVYGGGVFARLFPVRFLFVQGQLEHNFINQKYIQPNGGTSKADERATSLLVGGGYTTGRYGGSGNSFGYLAVLFDVLKDQDSPYTDNAGRVIPILRAGINVYLFQGRNRNEY
ncbi:MAG: hypothetical protein ABR503_14220 [Chitinophagaceae bacterium]